MTHTLICSDEHLFSSHFKVLQKSVSQLCSVNKMQASKLQFHPCKSKTLKELIDDQIIKTDHMRPCGHFYFKFF